MKLAPLARSGKLVAVGVGMLVLAACNDDGRTLRPARPDQNASVSTLGEPTTLEPTFDNGDNGGIDDGGDLGGSQVATFDTLPLGQTAPPTVDGVATTMAGATGDSSDLPGVSDVAPIGSSDLPAGSGGAVGGDEAVLTGPFAQDEPIPAKYTCDDDNNSPPLTWSHAPEGTIEIGISMIDNDAPGFIHWVMAGIDPDVTSLDEAEVPEGAIVGQSSVGGDGYYGPCPPTTGSVHHYVFTVHFLAQQTELSSGAAAVDLLAAIDGATFGGASLVGTYSRT